MDAYASHLATTSYHLYPLNACFNNVTVEELLDPAISQNFVTKMAPFVQLSEARGVPLWIGETNSNGCAVAKGVEDGYGAVLWAVDYLFALTAINVTGANFHVRLSSSPFSPFYIVITHSYK
jgi:hypothetical protein